MKKYSLPDIKYVARRKIKQGNGARVVPAEWWEGGVVILNRMVRDGLADKVTFQRVLKGVRREAVCSVSGQHCRPRRQPVRRPKVGECLVCAEKQQVGQCDWGLVTGQ